MRGTTPRREHWLWVGFATSMALATGWMWIAAPSDAQRFRWDWQPALAAAEPWRVFTAAWVHWSVQHAALNAAAMTVLAAFGWVARLPRAATVAWLIAWPMTHLAMLAATVPTHYGGLSGIAHAGACVAGVWLVATPGPASRRMLGGVWLALLVLKLAFEVRVGPTLLGRGADAVVSVPAAHVCGALAGFAAAILLLAWHLPRRKPERGR